MSVLKCQTNSVLDIYAIAHNYVFIHLWDKLGQVAIETFASGTEISINKYKGLRELPILI